MQTITSVTLCTSSSTSACLPAIHSICRESSCPTRGIAASQRRLLSKSRRTQRYWRGLRNQLERPHLLCKASDFAAQADLELPTHLNNVPHQRETRKFFYKDVTEAILSAVKGGEKRMSVRCTVPELNPEMDVFRIGTLLELCRDISTGLAQDGRRVKVCVQKAMGQGVFQGLPLSLSGVRAIMERMDWGDVADFVDFGHVGADQIDDAGFYILIAPQNVVGNTIMTPLLEMVDAAEAQGKHIVLVNPLLKDIPSSGGIMQVRGRKERMEFADSFAVAYHFRLLYQSSALMYPIMGALRKTYDGPWQVFRRVDTGKRQEVYKLADKFETQPSSANMTPLFAVQAKKPTWKRYYTA